jgi:hypothetical protein
VLLHAAKALQRQNPFAPWLILKYDCHINVEFSTSVQLFQYLFKYFFKPLDSANWKVTIEHPADNIPRSLGGRKPIDEIH